MKWFKWGRSLRRRYGHGAGDPKRNEGVKVDREEGRMYYVKGDGSVWSAPMKKR